VPPGDAVALSQAIARLAREPVLRRAMGTAARADMVARYSAARLAEDLDRLYTSLLRDRMAQ
jgi:glycosyltransferase involved in cell wall biosynthesis